jgi:hypothetical protein
MNWHAASVTAPFLLTACCTLPTERQLVGTWTAPVKETTITNGSGLQHSYSKEMVDLTLTSDHRLVFWARGQRSPDSVGHWRLDGQRLISEFTRRNEGHKIWHSYRDKIIKLTPHELVYVQSADDPGVEIHLTKRSSEPPTGEKISK